MPGDPYTDPATGVRGDAAPMRKMLDDLVQEG
jgi:hypothetical protein